MAILIENARTERLALELAALTGESLDQALDAAVVERYHRMQLDAKLTPLHERLEDIARRCNQLPVISDMTDDEILGYDEFGVPTR